MANIIIRGYGICVDQLEVTADSIRQALLLAPASEAEICKDLDDENICYDYATLEEFNKLLYYPMNGSSCVGYIFSSVLDEIMPLHVAIFKSIEGSVYVLHEPKFLWEYPKLKVELIETAGDMEYYFKEVLKVLNVGKNDIPVQVHSVECPLC